MPLAELDDLVFGGWDIFEDNAYEAAKHAGVLVERGPRRRSRPFLESIRPMPGVFEPAYVKKLHGTHVKKGKSKMDLAEQLIADIERFKTHQRRRPLRRGLVRLDRGLPRAVATCTRRWRSSRRACKSNDENIAPSAIYAYALLCARACRYANGAPNLSVDFPAMLELAKQKSVPICGKDFKTGQTLMKTILAPGFKARYLGVEGWYSTNILGNRDGEVLDDPESFKSKEVSKLGVLEHILQPHLLPRPLQGHLATSCASTTTRRAATTKRAGTTSISSAGSATRCRSRSTSCAATRSWPRRSCSTWRCSWTWRSAAGMSGIQEWLSFYFKSPMTPPGLYPEHDLFIQLMKLKNTLRHLRGEELITHLGTEYYD